MANLSSYLPGGIDPAAVTITGGTINGTTIGASTAAAGTFTTFTSTGIDDNATSTAITIDASENVGISDTTPENKLTVVDIDAGSGIAPVKARTATVNGRASYQIGNDADNWFMGIDGGNSDAFFISDAVGSSDRFVITQGGNVGIGTTSPSQTLHVFGAIRLTASGTDANRYNVYWNGSTGDFILVSSDARLKKDFDYDIEGIETVKNLKPLRFTWKEDNKKQLGFLAQESLEADENLAWHDEENDQWGLDGWEGYAAVLTKAVQEQQAMIETLQAEVAALKGA